MLYILTLLVHLNLKYHNLQRELIIANVDLERAKGIYQVLQNYQGQGASKEINLTTLTIQVIMIGIRPHEVDRPKKGEQEE